VSNITRVTSPLIAREYDLSKLGIIWSIADAIRFSAALLRVDVGGRSTLMVRSAISASNR
jgi:hypothetical protein